MPRPRALRDSTPPDAMGAFLHLEWGTSGPIVIFSTKEPEADPHQANGNRPHGPPGPGPQPEATPRRRSQDTETARTLALHSGRHPLTYRTALVLSHLTHPLRGPRFLRPRVDLAFLDTRYAIAHLPYTGSPGGIWLRFRPPSLRGTRGDLTGQLRETLVRLGAQTGLGLDKKDPPRAVTYAVTSEYSSRGRTDRAHSIQEWKNDAQRIGLAVERLAGELGARPQEIADTPRLLFYYRFHFLVTSVEEAVQWTLDETLELLIPALNGIPNARAFAGAVNRLRLIHHSRPLEVAEAATWLAALCATFAPTDRSGDFIRNLTYRVRYSFPPPRGHAQGAAPARPTHPQDAQKEPWIACARARATVMRGSALTEGGRTPEDLCTPCCDVTRSPGTGAAITRGLLRVVAGPCQLAAQNAARCASHTAKEELQMTDTPMRCSRARRCRFTTDKCHPEVDTELLGTLPEGAAPLTGPVQLPPLARATRTERTETRAGKKRCADVQVADLREIIGSARARPHQGPRYRSVSAQDRRGGACPATRNPGHAESGRTDGGANGRHARKRKDDPRLAENAGPGPGGLRMGDVYHLPDGLRRTYGAICKFCGHANHTAKDCSLRQAIRKPAGTLRPVGIKEAQWAETLILEEESGMSGTGSDRTRTSSPEGLSSSDPPVICSSIIRPRPSDTESDDSEEGRPRHRDRKQRCGRYQAPKIGQTDGADDVPDLTSSSEDEDDQGGEKMPGRMAPLTHHGYQVTASVNGRPLRFLIDTGMSFSCITKTDLRHLQRYAPTGAVELGQTGQVVVRLHVPRLRARKTTLRVVPDHCGFESTLGWDTLREWGASIEFPHDSCACPRKHPHLTAAGACTPLNPEPTQASRNSPFH